MGRDTLFPIFKQKAGEKVGKKNKKNGRSYG
jgi:hypothetical protein